MKPVERNKTKVIIIVSVSDRISEEKKPGIHPAILKAISFIVITIISWLTPEATVAIFITKLLFILLEWLNQNKA